MIFIVTDRTYSRITKCPCGGHVPVLDYSGSYSGNSSIAIGYNALHQLTTGNKSTPIGNTVVGPYGIQSAGPNISIGHTAGTIPASSYCKTPTDPIAASTLAAYRNQRIGTPVGYNLQAVTPCHSYRSVTIHRKICYL